MNTFAVMPADPRSRRFQSLRVTGEPLGLPEERR